MKERPILFNGEMVRAILDWRKTQTRRPMKVQPPVFIDSLHGGKLSSRPPYQLRDDNDRPCGFGFQDDQGNYWIPPLGTIGDRLWVRETWMDCDIPKGMFGAAQVVRGPESNRVENWIKAAWHKDSPDPGGWPIRRGWKPSIHMPRWASRITLEITGVRVERVREISDNDAESEGVDLRRLCGCVEGCATCDDRSPSEVFRDLWQSIYGNWDANPWVWVYEFRRIKP